MNIVSFFPLCLSLLLLLSHQGYGRWKNSEYLQFITILEETKKNHTAENKVWSQQLYTQTNEQSKIKCRINQRIIYKNTSELITRNLSLFLCFLCRKKWDAMTLTSHTGLRISAGQKSAIRKFMHRCSLFIWNDLVCCGSVTIRVSSL